MSTPVVPEAPFYPDEAHEDLRRRSMAAVARLRAQQLSTDDAMMLINGLAEIAATLGGAIPASDATHQAINTRIDASNINIATALAGVDDLQKKLATQVTNLAAEVTRATLAEAAITKRLTAVETPPFIAGQVYGTSGGAFTYNMTHGQLQTVRMTVPTGSAPIKGMACEVITAGATGRILRMGLFADNGSGFPGALLGSGILSPLSVGGKVLTFANPISYVGTLHLAVRCETSTGYAATIKVPEIRGVTAYLEDVPTLMSGTAAASLVSATTATGAFTASPAMVPDIGGGPRLTLVL